MGLIVASLLAAFTTWSIVPADSGGAAQALATTAESPVLRIAASSSEAQDATTHPAAPTCVAPLERPFHGLLFGIGPEADQAVRLPLVQEAPVGILSSWFNRPRDLAFFKGWKSSGEIEAWWARGQVPHVITFEDVTPGLGHRPYHISDQFLADVRELAAVFAGPADGKHPVLFTLATEFQTYVDPHNGYNLQTAWYYDRLIANLRQAREEIRRIAPNAFVGISWGGWQTRWDIPATGTGLSMIPFFGDLMRSMDFVSFQAMANEPFQNLQDIERGLSVFSTYNPRLMVSHYMPDNRSPSTFSSDVTALFAGDYLAQARAKGLFAFSFMDGALLIDPGIRSTVTDGIRRHAVDPPRGCAAREPED